MKILSNLGAAGCPAGMDNDTDTWAGLVQQIAELEEILREAAASPDQDAFGERAALTRVLASRRRALRELDVALVFSARAAPQPGGRRHRWRVEDA